MSFSLSLYVQPNAKQNEVVGWHDQRIKIRLQSPAIEDKANHALIAFLAKQLGMPRNKIILEKGEKSRIKTCKILIEQADLLNNRKIDTPLLQLLQAAS